MRHVAASSSFFTCGDGYVNGYEKNRKHQGDNFFSLAEQTDDATRVASGHVASTRQALKRICESIPA
jgi:hypothetical protein